MSENVNPVFLKKRVEFAKLCGVSRSSITQLAKKGKIIIDENGRINTNNPTNAAYLREKCTKPPPRGEVLGPGGRPPRNPESAGLDDIKTIEQIETARLKNEILRKKYIERNLVAQTFSQIHTVDIQQIVPLADTFPAVAMAICGVSDEKMEHEIRSRLKKEIYRALQHRKRIMDDFIADPWREREEFGR